MSINGTDIKRLTKTCSTLSDDDYPSFSPDSTRIVFTRGTYDHSEIYLMNADGTGLKRLTDNGRTNSQASFSPDGTKIIFIHSDLTSGPGIYIMNADGTGQKRLTRNIAAGNPAFSPDGTKIIFTKYYTLDVDPISEIYIMNADGSGLKRMITTPRSDDQPTWQPIIDSSLSSLPSRISVHDDDYYDILLSEADLFQWSGLLFWRID